MMDSAFAQARNWDDDPTDYFDAHAVRRARRWMTREQQLCLAVLERALEDARYDYRIRHGADIRDDARQCFAADTPPSVREYHFSFETVCDVLGLNPVPIRECVLADTATVRQHIRRQ